MYGLIGIDRDDYIPCDSSANLKEIINASW